MVGMQGMLLRSWRRPARFLPLVHKMRSGSRLRRDLLPKVTATKTSCLDPYLKSEMLTGARAVNELARTQTFVLDAIAPLTTVQKSK